MTHKVGRNAPCPCGSGRKYKQCCLRNAPRGPRYTSYERKLAIAKLHQGLDALEDDDIWQEIESGLVDEFWGELGEQLGAITDGGLLTMTTAAFHDWVLFDVVLDCELRTLDIVLENAPALRDGELVWLEQQKAQCLRLYEVTEVRRGSSLTLRDLLGGAEITVHEHLGSESVERWDLLAARVMPIGASGRPEMDGAALHFPRMYREHLVGRLQTEIAELHREHPAASETELMKLCAPGIHQMWFSLIVQPPAPELITTTGEPVLMTTVRFDVADADALVRALDSCAALERERDETLWHWLAASEETDGKKGDSILGVLKLEDGRLTLETMSRERAIKGRALVEELAGEAVRHAATSHEDPLQMMREALPSTNGTDSEAPLSEDIEDAILGHYETHYRHWVDEAIPALDGATPHAAALSSKLRPRLIAMLRDLEHMYLRSLSRGEPAYDPSWLWSELGLEQHPDAPPRSGDVPPRLGHAAIERVVPGIGDVAREIASRYRRASDDPGATVVTFEELDVDLAFVRFLRDQAEAARRAGKGADAANRHASLIGSHLEYFVNHEVHHRKTFWVDEPLAWQLGHTALDLTGNMLRLPYGSCAFVFTDRHSLGLAERVMASDPECELRGQMIRALTAYASQRPLGDGSHLRLSFTFDALDERWPWLLVRELKVDPEADLDAVLDSHLPGINPARLDPVFTAPATRRLLHLVIAAILYATSAGVEAKPITPPPRDSGWPRLDLLCSDTVYHLPGKIEISHLRQMQAVERGPSGRRLMHRFMVRGHWRRANPSWKDQRPRWIRPHWKGPDLAVIIEREYQMSP
jgi:hypothetical protein